MEKSLTRVLDGLNDKQKEAVLSGDGPLLVLAGAGSGKTRVIAHRIGFLLREKGVSPYSILAVTFTNKAANEMKERVLKLMGVERLPFLWIGTFHSICARILREDVEKLNSRLNRHFTIFDREDSRSLIKKILKEEKKKETTFSPSEIIDYFTLIKRGVGGIRLNSEILSIYNLYQKSLYEQNAIDFDDLLILTVKLLKEVDEVREKYQDRFKYILVDEYQDTNDIQEDLLTILSRKWHNLFLVGDEDQSIYGFRGSKVRHIVEFPKRYLNCKIVRLEKNYRSFDTIVKAASLLVAHNKQRLGKNLFTEKKGGSKIKLFAAQSDREEAEFVGQEILKLKDIYPYKQIAVLMRTNAQSRGIEEVFLNLSIPYQIVGGIKFYERKEIKDVLAYLKLAINPYDRVSLLRIINTPTRGIGKTTIESLEKISFDRNIPLFRTIESCIEEKLFSQKTTNSLKDFVDTIKILKEEITQKNPSSVIKSLIERIKFKEYLETQNDLKRESRIENLEELVSAVKEFESREGGSLEMFLERQSLSSDQDELNGENFDSVKIMTIHSAKGLEFPVVFVIGLEDGFFPHERSKAKEEEVEEERRLLYVGMTRAMEKLYFTYSNVRFIYGNVIARDPSPFLSEIPAHYIEKEKGRIGGSFKLSNVKQLLEKEPLKDQNLFKPGMRVYHKIYGVGVVLSSDGEGENLKVTVSFSKFGRKKLLNRVAKLEVM